MAIVEGKFYQKSTDKKLALYRCQQSNMAVHPSQSRLMHSSLADRKPIQVNMVYIIFL